MLDDKTVLRLILDWRHRGQEAFDAAQEEDCEEKKLLEYGSLIYFFCSDELKMALIRESKFIQCLQSCFNSTDSCEIPDM